MKTKTSDIWQYFEEVDIDYAKCKTCNKNYSRKGRTTTSLRGHLRSMHTDKYAELCKIGEQREIVNINHIKIAVTPLQAKGNITMEELTQEDQTWEPSCSNTKTVDDLIGEMIALQDLPFDFVDGIGFRRMMQAVSPNYELRGHQYYTDHVCDLMYTKMTIKIREMLKQFHKLSIIVDICSGPTTDLSLLTFTAHGITKDFDQRRIVLNCCLLHGHYTDDIVCDHLTKMLLEWNIKEEQLHCFIHYGTLNISTITHLAHIPSVSCTVQQLQQCVSSALNSPEVRDLIAKCKNITEHFTQSQMAKDELFKIQRDQLNQPTLNVVQDCDNRWNGTYHMVERLVKIKDSICLYACKHDIPQFFPEEWLTLKKILPILTLFDEVTTTLIQTKTGISSVIPLIYVLKHNLWIELDKNKTNQSIVNIIRHLIDQINVRFDDLSNNLLYSLATYLDPRYKSKFFNEIEKERVQSELLRLLMSHDQSNVGAVSDVVDTNGGNNSDESDNDSEPRFVAKRPKIEFIDTNNEPRMSSQNLQPIENIHSALAVMLKSDSDDEEDTGNDSIVSNINVIVLKSLINEYNQQKRLHINEDPLLWWKYNTHVQAFLPIVLTYLPTPPGSFPIEQLSSEFLNNGLDNDKTAKILFVKYNLPLINFDY